MTGPLLWARGRIVTWLEGMVEPVSPPHGQKENGGERESEHICTQGVKASYPLQGHTPNDRKTSHLAPSLKSRITLPIVPLRVSNLSHVGLWVDL